VRLVQPALSAFLLCLRFGFVWTLFAFSSCCNLHLLTYSRVYQRPAVELENSTLFRSEQGSEREREMECQTVASNRNEINAYTQGRSHRGGRVPRPHSPYTMSPVVRFVDVCVPLSLFWRPLSSLQRDSTEKDQQQQHFIYTVNEDRLLYFELWYGAAPLFAVSAPSTSLSFRSKAENVDIRPCMHALPHCLHVKLFISRLACSGHWHFGNWRFRVQLFYLF